MLTTEIKDKFMAAIKEGTAELAKLENGTYQIQEVLNELNRVLGLTIVVQDGYLYAGNAKIFAFEPINRGFPVHSGKVYIENQHELIDFLCHKLRNPEIVKLIREQQNAK